MNRLLLVATVCTVILAIPLLIAFNWKVRVHGLASCDGKPVTGTVTFQRIEDGEPVGRVWTARARAGKYEIFLPAGLYEMRVESEDGTRTPIGVAVNVERWANTHHYQWRSPPGS
jgi:hypothetical protein